MSSEVWAYSESEAVSNEVASAAAEVARGCSCQPVVVDIGAGRSGVKASGAKLLLSGPAGPEVSPEVAAEAVARAAKQKQPLAILIGATRDGREVAARLAAKLHVGCLSEVSRVASDGRVLSGERNAFAGKVVAKVECALPAVATVKVGYYPATGSSPQGASEVDVGAVQGLVKVVRRDKKAVGAVDLKAAKVIVSAGRGVK